MDLDRDIVTLNKPVKVRFKNGSPMMITIYSDTPVSQVGFLVNINAPLAKAILGQPFGKTIAFKVEEKIVVVKIIGY